MRGVALSRAVHPLLATCDRRLGVAALLFAFWTAFWGLNGADKFFNGGSRHNRAVTIGVVQDRDGAIVQRMHPVQPTGWYGVTRDAKFIAYFRTLGLPAGVALSVLYAIGIGQLLLAALFGALLWWALLPPAQRPRHELYSQRVLQRLAFKASLIVFCLFCLGDILFGDRMELWEHGTYMIVVLVTWQAWYRADQHSMLAADAQPVVASLRGAGASPPPAAMIPL